MSQFFEILSPGDIRQYVKSSDVLRIESPPGLEASEAAPPERPIKLHMKDGTVLESYASGATRLLLSILYQQAACVFMDTAFNDQA